MAAKQTAAEIARRKAMTKVERELEDYLASMQKAQVVIMREDGTLAKMIQGAMSDEKFYLTDNGQRELLSELKEYLGELTEQTGARGRLMSAKTMKAFLEKDELRGQTQEQLQALSKLSQRQIERRLALYETRLEKEYNYTQSEIREFFLNAEISGRSRADALKELIKASGDNEGLAAGFEKRAARVAVDAGRREAQEQSMDVYRAASIPGEEWQWVTVSGNPCPDCRARSGKVASLEWWQSNGTPGAGRTVCGNKCMCQLVPVSISEKLYPDVKEYQFDRDSLVLTTAAEARTLRSVAHAAPQNK